MPARLFNFILVTIFVGLVGIDLLTAGSACGNALANVHSRRIWSDISLAFEREMTRVISEHPEIWQGVDTGKPAIPSSKGDPFIHFLQQLGASFQEPIGLPSLEIIMEELEKRRVKIKDRFGWSDREVFRYLFHFVSVKGEHLHLSYGDQVPVGFHPVSVLMSSDSYFDFLGQAIQTMGPGDYIGESEYNGADHTTILGHDLVHAYLYTEYPNLGRAVVRGVERLRTQGVTDLSKDIKLMNRVGYTNESLELPNPKNYQRLDQLISVPDRPQGHIFSVAEIQAHLRERYPTNPDSVRQIQENLVLLRNEWNDLIIAYGGSSADPGYNYRTGQLGPGFIKAHFQMAVRASWGDSHIPYDEVARLYADLVNFRLITAAEWVEQSYQLIFETDSLLYKILIQSGSLDGTFLRWSYQ